VQDLARRLGVARRRGRAEVEVNLPALRTAFLSYAREEPEGIVVGHLAHFLPVSYIVVLRCHPLELARRLRRSRRTRIDVSANVLSEALDVVLVEALGVGVPVREIDTTGRSVSDVARTVTGVARRRPAARYGRTDWLADPRVTEELLREALWTERMVLERYRARLAPYMDRWVRPWLGWSPAGLSWIGFGLLGGAGLFSLLVRYTTPYLFLLVAILIFAGGAFDVLDG
jgi:adenylate kinase